MKPSKIHDDFRIYCAYFYSLIAIGISLLIINPIFSNSVTLEQISFCYRIWWSLVFTLLGFSLLVVKVCINYIYSTEPVKKKNENDNEVYEREKAEEKTKLDKIKAKWRYMTYYPLMLLVLASSSAIASTYQFNSDKDSYLGISALISFFLGYFIDSLPGVIDKLGGAK